MIRMRIFYAKSGYLIYTGNLDVQKVWERATRRAGLFLAYSAGFHPQARIQQACPLPLGFSSEEEIVDIWFEKRYSYKFLQKRISSSLPLGIQIKSIERIELSAPPMQNLVTAADYEVFVFEESILKDIKERVNTLMCLDDFQFKKRDRTINLRARIISIHVIQDKSIGPLIMHMQLKHIPSANGRPDDVLLALGIDPLAAKIIRTRIYHQIQK